MDDARDLETGATDEEEDEEWRRRFEMPHEGLAMAPLQRYVSHLGQLDEGFGAQPV